MKPIQQINPVEVKKLKGILSDLDDTITIKGKIYPEAINALWNLKNTGLRTVIVTGRPAGWADHIARMWPVDAVVGENGAFYFYLTKKGMQRYYIQTDSEREKNRIILENIKNKILTEIKNVKVASDQFSRISDLAIDFAEDISPALPYEESMKIVDIFKSFGAVAKISSIHVNGWIGQFNKLSCFITLARNLWNESEQDVKDHYLYCGDSPNDVPMFQFFKNSVGMANLKDFFNILKQDEYPSYITSKKEGHGFIETVNKIIDCF